MQLLGSDCVAQEIAPQVLRKGANSVKFHQPFARLLEAPTEAIASLIQDEILTWLIEVKEMRASIWFEKTWTVQHGYYSNASASCVGNKKAAGCESNWR
jgi:hypothetical protein